MSNCDPKQTSSQRVRVDFPALNDQIGRKMDKARSPNQYIAIVPIA